MKRQSNPIIEFIYEYLKNKSELSELEKDILDSIKEFNKECIDRNSLISRIRANIAKYNWLVQEEVIKVTSLMLKGVQPTFTPYEQSEEVDLLEKLSNQIMIFLLFIQRFFVYFLIFMLSTFFI